MMQAHQQLFSQLSSPTKSIPTNRSCLMSLTCFSVAMSHGPRCTVCGDQCQCVVCIQQVHATLYVWCICRCQAKTSTYQMQQHKSQCAMYVPHHPANNALSCKLETVQGRCNCYAQSNIHVQNCAHPHAWLQTCQCQPLKHVSHLQCSHLHQIKQLLHGAIECPVQVRRDHHHMLISGNRLHNLVRHVHIHKVKE